MGRGNLVVRSWLHRRVLRTWQARGPLARLLYPLTWVYRLGRSLHAWGQTAVRVDVPVVVVGNLRVGGTGKTPLVIRLTEALRERGWHPGVVSRGYGGQAGDAARLVDADADPNRFGDEPVLIRYTTAVPVAVGKDRVAAARLLRRMHPEIDVIIADDGLQHRRLARNVELALINETGTGNGWQLPAGPLREPVRRLERVDAVVLHGATPPVRIHTPFFRMRTAIRNAVRMADPPQRQSLAELSQAQRERDLRLLAFCAIGNPDRFFAMLRAHGLVFDTLALPDHEPIDAAVLAGKSHDRILVTSKDAVKCHRDARLRKDERIWVVPLEVDLDPACVDFVERRIAATADPGTRAGELQHR